MNKTIIYTDGACKNNGAQDAVGGYGIVIIKDGEEMEYRRAFTGVTNNKMELVAVIDALRLAEPDNDIEVYSDSAYVINAVNNEWLSNWKRNNWRNSSGPVKNRELWVALDSLLSVRNVSFFKVKGHSTDKYNNRCDYLANLAVKEYHSALGRPNLTRSVLQLAY